MSMNWETIIVALIAASFPLIGTIVTNRQQTRLMDYRLKKLEEKVGQHNNLEGRVITLETQMRDYHHTA